MTDPRPSSVPSVQPVMPAILRIVRLLAIVVWVGGLIFFAFVLAPTAFSVLPTHRDAGAIVGATLSTLNKLGDVCYFFFFFATIQSWRWQSTRRRRLLTAEIAMVLAMFVATVYVQARIVPAMERDRMAAGGDIDSAPADNPARLDFERLHPLSEKVEGAALLLGLGVVILLGMEGCGPPRTQRIEDREPTR